MNGILVALSTVVLAWSLGYWWCNHAPGWRERAQRRMFNERAD